jgi:hypothetical protein
MAEQIPFTWDFSGQGVVDVMIPTPPVNNHSIVLASATQVETHVDGSFPTPFIGAASIEVLNIAPQDRGKLYIRVNIMWDEPLFVRISGLVIQVV